MLCLELWGWNCGAECCGVRYMVFNNVGLELRCLIYGVSVIVLSVMGLELWLCRVVVVFPSVVELITLVPGFPGIGIVR